MCKSSEYLGHVRGAVEGEGATVIDISVTGRGHRRIDFAISGRRGIVFLSSTPNQAKDLKMIAIARRVVRRVKEKV